MNGDLPVGPVIVIYPGDPRMSLLVALLTTLYPTPTAILN
jgi:hypothetical protein